MEKEEEEEAMERLIYECVHGLLFIQLLLLSSILERRMELEGREGWARLIINPLPQPSQQINKPTNKREE